MLAELIKKFEGCKLKAYLCPAGVWTIGYGHTGDVTKNMRITQEQADYLLLKDAQEALYAAITASPILSHHTESKQAAIADFIFNLGVGNYKNSTLKKRVDAEDWVGAQIQILRWDKATVGGKLVKLPGLTRRRNEEAALLE